MSYREEFRLNGEHLVEKVKELVREGNVTRLRITACDEEFHLEMPVTAGVLAGGALVVAAPWLALLGAVAGLFTKVKVEVERDADAGTDDTPTAEEEEFRELGDNMPI